MPLSFVIARYFAYAFAAVATAWLVSFMVLSVAINAGIVYEASWGPANAREIAEGLARDGVCGQQDVPTAYRYLILNKDGNVLMTDLESTRLEDATEMARTALAADPGTVEIEGGGSGVTYAAFPLKGGGACALVSEYLPQWVSRDLAGPLPNPQNLMLVGATAGSALALALVARRASRVISRKMAPRWTPCGPPSPSRSRPAGPRSGGSASRWRHSPTTSRRRSPCCAPTPTSWRRSWKTRKTPTSRPPRAT